MVACDKKKKNQYCFLDLEVILECSASLKAYAHDDVSVGSWMMGVNTTYIDESRLCCSYSGQGNVCIYGSSIK